MATFDFNRMALHATQPKLHSIFCALILKIALSAAKLMSFGHLGAATVVADFGPEVYLGYFSSKMSKSSL